MSESTSAYGKGFAVRMIVLLLLLGAVGFGFYYDGQLKSKADEKIQGMMNTLLARTSNGKGLSKADVQKEFGFPPAASSSVDKYEVERYEFKRVLPFSKGQFVTVVYNQDQVHDAIANKDFDPTAKSDLMSGVKTMDPADRTQPESALSGGGGGDEEIPADDGDKKDDDGDADEKKDDATDEKKDEGTDEKKDDGDQ